MSAAWLRRPAFVAPVLAGASLVLSFQMASYRLAGSDAGALLTAASRILRGGVFYRDVDSYPFPLAAYALALVMRLFGETVGVSRGLAAVVFAATVLALYATALRLLGRDRALVFGASLLAFKLLAWPSFTAFSYWDLAFALACGAVALLVRHRPGSGAVGPAAAGLLAGLAVTAKQSLGLPLCAAALLVLAAPRGVSGAPAGERRRRLAEPAFFAAAAAIPVLAMSAYFAAQGVLPRMIESGLLLPFSHYLPTSSTSFLEPLAWWRFGGLQELPGLAYSSEPLWTMLTHRQLPAESLYPAFWGLSEALSRAIYTSVPWAFALVAWRRLRGRDGEPDAHREAPFALLAAGVFVSAFPRADFAHVIAVYPLVWLLLFALWRPGPRGRALEAVAVSLAVAGCLTLTVLQQRRLTHHLELPRADLWISRDKAWIESAARFVMDEVPPSEPFFVYGHEAYYYFLTDRYSPWPYSQLYPGQAGGDGGRVLAARLAQAPPLLVLRGATRFPRTTPLPESLPVLDTWIREHYEPDDAVFERHPPDGPPPPTRRFRMLRWRG